MWEIEKSGYWLQPTKVFVWDRWGEVLWKRDAAPHAAPHPAPFGAVWSSCQSLANQKWCPIPCPCRSSLAPEWLSECKPHLGVCPEEGKTDKSLAQRCIWLQDLSVHFVAAETMLVPRMAAISYFSLSFFFFLFFLPFFFSFILLLISPSWYLGNLTFPGLEFAKSKLCEMLYFDGMFALNFARFLIF